MLIYRQTALKRDVDAAEIPSGEKALLRTGTQVVVMQALGGHYTVMTPDGHQMRIDGKDGDAIGEQVIDAAPLAAVAPGGPLDQAVLEQLRTVYDPEIPVNIVELGLVYLCEVADGKAKIRMTLTAPGCGMGQVLKTDVEQKVRAIPGIQDVDVELVWEPPWDKSRMSEAAKLQLGFF